MESGGIIASLARFDYIIDVRSPREFGESHIPTALNLPVLDDIEYERVGSLYKRDRLEANFVGVELICRNISRILEENRAIFRHSKTFLIYCARGGNRSFSLCQILSALGLRVERIMGGYKAYRNEVLRTLDMPPKQHFLTLCGNTGCGKSEIVKMAESWSVDLEALCGHFGSAFGFMAGAQPSVKMLQNSLVYELNRKDSPILLIENESKQLGKLTIPTALFNAYKAAPKVLITASLEKRVVRIVALYERIKASDFHAAMAKIAPYISRNTRLAALEAFKKRDLPRVAELLLTQYYDKVYRKVACEFAVHSDDLEKAYGEVEGIARELTYK